MREAPLVKFPKSSCCAMVPLYEASHLALLHPSNKTPPKVILQGGCIIGSLINACFCSAWLGTRHRLQLFSSATILYILDFS